MAKTKVFCSFDYSHDLDKKRSLIRQSEKQDSPFAIKDFSLQEVQPESDWLSKAQRAIGKCDVFVVLLGENTHSAPGVLQEVAIARGLNKRRFQLMPQGRNHGALKGAGKLVVWTWENLQAELNPRSIRGTKNGH